MSPLAAGNALLSQQDLLDSITRAQTRFIAEAPLDEIFDGLLDDLLSLTDSEYGFIGEVLLEPDGTPWLRTRAITNIAWNEETRRFFEQHAPQGLEFRNLDTLFGETLRTARPVIANDPANDDRGGGTPPGHPPLRRYLGVPMWSGGRFVGMAGIANGRTDYGDALVKELEPFLATCANIIDAARSSRQRDEAVSALRESEGRHRAVLEAMREAILTFAADGTVLSANRAAAELFGCPLARLRGARVADLLERPSQALAGAGWPAPLAETVETHARRADGTRVSIEVSITALDEGAAGAACALIRDTTERHEVEELKHAFTSHVSHELRTPLAAIHGFGALLRDGVLGQLADDQQELAERIVVNAEQLQRMIGDLVDLAKAEAGQLGLEPTCFDLAELLTAVGPRARDTAGSLGLELELTVAPDLPEMVADTHRLQQVLESLLDNAYQASAEGQRVELQARREGPWVRIAVLDEGTGVPEAERERIFETGVQLGNPAGGSRRGLGLGLPACRRLVTLQGGCLEVSERPGSGSVFAFTLPVLALPPALRDQGAISLVLAVLRPTGPGEVPERGLGGALQAVTRRVVRDRHHLLPPRPTPDGAHVLPVVTTAAEPECERLVHALAEELGDEPTLRSLGLSVSVQCAGTWPDDGGWTERLSDALRRAARDTTTTE